MVFRQAPLPHASIIGMAILRYNPYRAPRPADWLALDEPARARLVERYHEQADDLAGSPEVHALLHTIVETQLAEGDKPAVRALARLRAEGLDRHECLHALASVMVPLMGKAIGGQTVPENMKRDLDRSLAQLTAERWRASVVDDEFGQDLPGLIQPRAGLTEADLDRLEQFLADLPAPAMNLESVDGFFCALISGPELVSVNEYLPEVWGPEPPFESEAEFREIFGLLMQHWNGIADDLLRTLSDPEHRYYPVISEDEHGVAHGNDWAHGYWRGVELRRQAWAPLLADREIGCLVPMMILLHEHDPDPKRRSPPMSVEQRDELLISLMAGAMAAYRYFEPMRRTAALADPLHGETIRRAGPKVGRNDPCPCGSGRKYKRCCGAGPGSPTLH